MPSPSEKIALADPFLDRRTRLLPCQRERTLALRNRDGMSYRAIAKLMGVSRRLVYFVVNPDKQAEQKAGALLRQADGRYYDRQRHTAAVREHRRHKQALLSTDT